MQSAAQPLYKTISPLDRWLVTLVVMLAALMEIIDTTIVNVCLPHMQGSLGATSDTVTWTLTSYIVSAAICMPLTGFLAERYGRKNFLIFSIMAFTVASALCGAATSLSEMVTFRLLQGVFGASLVPLSQAILTDVFPPEDRAKAMAIWGIGIMVGPIFGPTLGGYLTDIASWRWTFYINVPIGAFALLLSNIIPDTPKQIRRLDWVGISLISLAIGGLQYVLDRGNQDDWFNATSICLITYIAFTAAFLFVLHNMGVKKDRIFSLGIFKDINFSLASLLLALFCFNLYGILVTQPLMMEGFLHYSALATGMMLAPRGLSGMISMLLVSQLIKHIDARALIFFGISLNAAGIWIATSYSLSISSVWLIGPMILQGFGLGLVFVPLSTIAFSTLPQHLRTEAAGLYSLIRTLGGSIGISVASTLYARRQQFFWNELGGSINVYHPALYQYLHPLALNPTQALGANLLGNELYQQTAMLSFVNVFAFIMWCLILMLPLVFLLRKSKQSANSTPGLH